MDKIKDKIEQILGSGYNFQTSGFLMWIYDSKTSKPIGRIDLNYAHEMDKRNELGNYIKQLIK